MDTVIVLEDSEVEDDPDSVMTDPKNRPFLKG